MSVSSKDLEKNPSKGFVNVESDSSIDQTEVLDVKEPFFKKILSDFKPVEIIPLDPNLTKEQRSIAATANVPLKKKLKPRHIQMIAIGGAIGAGLFIASGGKLKTGGPGGVLIGYCIIGFFMFLTMTALGELGVRYPVNGVFSAYNTRFLDRSWGFSIGWLYALSFLISLPTELNAAAVTIGYWKGDHNGATEVNAAAWVALFLAVIAGINLFGIRGYGEAESVFSLIKVITIIGFIILGIVLTCGGGPSHDHIGSRYWNDPGSFAHGAKGVISVFVGAAYAFSGTELAGLAAAETAAPHIAIPRACKQVFWRILIFYVVALTIIGCLVPYNDPRLGTASDASASPFVIAIKNAGISGLPSVINVVIMIAVLSVGNAAVFGASRTLVSLSAQGLAPRFLLTIDRQGRPTYALLVTLAFGLLGFIAASDKAGTAFDWLSSITGLASILVWGSINACFIRNRIAMKRAGISFDLLEYKAPLGVYGAAIGVTVSVVIICLQFWIGLFPIGGEGASAESFFESYLSAIIVLLLFIAHKAWDRTWPVKTEDIDLYTGVRVPDEEDLRREIVEAQRIMASKPMWYRIYRFWC